MKIKVSIVLPVYNAGEYLHQCIQSLIHQTLKEIEIIIVLDCPSDGSDRIAKEYAAQDERIRIIENNKNLRVGMSRNRGIDAAKGEYVGFCDHDDYITPDMFEVMYRNAMEYDSDIVICDVDYMNLSSGKTTVLKFPDNHGKELKEQVHNDILRNKLSGVIWNNIFRKEFLDKYKLRFGDNTIISPDDALFLSKVFFFTDCVSHCRTNDAPYKHRIGIISTAGTYTWFNLPLAVNTAVDLHQFLSARSLSYQQALCIAEGRVRYLYTAFRKELTYKGKRYTIRQAHYAAKSTAVHLLLKPLFTAKGCRYMLKNLPLTKIAFAFLLYMGGLRTGKP